jgi:hypothetical protein
MGVTVLTESRWTYESSRAQEDLVDRPVEMGGDTCRVSGTCMEYATRDWFDGLGLKTIGGGFHGFGPQNLGGGYEEE